MNLANLRKAKGWSQSDLADVVGVKQPTISRLEKGADEVTLRLCRQIAGALDVPLYLLFIDETAQAEMDILNIYRSLSEGRKKGWQDMAALAKADSHTED